MKRWTGKTAREAMGVGSIIDTHHEGPTKRPTEGGLDNFSPGTEKSPEDFRKERAEREAAEKEAARRKSRSGEARD